MDNLEKNIEIEFRSMFDENKYKELEEILKAQAKDLGEDNKNVYFFILSDKLLKVSDNISKKSAKITLKLEKIGQGSAFKEIEFPVDKASVPVAIELFKQLGYTHVIESFQQRHNYLLDGVELSLKYSKDWGYHLELEIMVKNESEREEAEFKIKELAQKLDVKLMSNNELAEFVKRFEAKK
ncbi:MAG: CYTH domain-containing protein [Candidatus Falkowbacteria bacterium]|nr:CYTH domain-containing protein [Candidatus Falkowbacteria bacterium]